MEWIILFALVGINLASRASFALDKTYAENGLHRISEDTLLTLAMLGGTPGAFAGRRLFRHKTRKQPFSTILWVIAMVQTGIAAGLAIAYMMA